MTEVLLLTDAACDQDHIPMLVDNYTKVPNRQEAILRNGEDPGPVIAKMGRRLQDAGADFLVMPCNSAHAFLEPLSQQTSIPFVSILEVTADACAHYEKVGILATDGCLETGGYQRALRKRNVEPLTPAAAELDELMGLISNIKAGDKGPGVTTAMRNVAQPLIDRGAQAIIAGCTEIPLILREGDISVPIINSTRVLAKATVAAAQ